MTRAEVVDGQADAVTAQVAQHSLRVLPVGHGGRLGDLDHEPLAIDTGPRDHVEDALDELGLPELTWREVHADVDRPAFVEPLARLPARLPHHPVGDRLDQSYVLG